MATKYFGAKKNQDTLLVLLIFLILAGLYYFTDTADTIKMVVQIEDADGDVVREDELQENPFTTQSLLGTFDSPFSLQSSLPKDAQVDEYAVFNVAIKNNYNVPVTLKKLNVYRNTQSLGSFLLPKETLQPGQAYVYQHKPILLTGNEGEKNLLQFQFILTDQYGTELNQVYQYVYLMLVPCTSNQDCGGPTPVCDLENIARLSKGTIFYCVATCADHAACADGQLCIKGRCGY